MIEGDSFLLFREFGTREFISGVVRVEYKRPGVVSWFIGYDGKEIVEVSAIIEDSTYKYIVEVCNGIGKEISIAKAARLALEWGYSSVDIAHTIGIPELHTGGCKDFEGVKKEETKMEFCNCGHTKYSLCLSLDGFMWFQCPNCGLDGENGRNTEEAILGWNKAIAEQKERVKE